MNQKLIVLHCIVLYPGFIQKVEVKFNKQMLVGKQDFSGTFLKQVESMFCKE